MKCYDCSRKVLDYYSVSFNTEFESVSLCSDCYNKRFQKICGVEAIKVKKTSLLVKDNSGNEHFFRIKKILTSTGFFLEAKEFINDEPKGYAFDVHGALDCDQIELEEKLLEKIKEGLNYHSINKFSTSGDALKEKVFGKIECDLDYDSEGPIMIIDGKKYTWEDFGKMLNMYEGWNFKLELY